MPPFAPTPCAARGKLETPQKQEQAQAPPAPAAPVPAAISVPALLLEAAPSVATAAAAAVEVASAAAPTLVVPPTMLAAVPVPFWAIANCMKSAWDFAAVGLIEKVMPLPQWGPCLQ